MKIGAVVVRTGFVSLAIDDELVGECLVSAGGQDLESPIVARRIVYEAVGDEFIVELQPHPRIAPRTLEFHELPVDLKDIALVITRLTCHSDGAVAVVPDRILPLPSGTDVSLISVGLGLGYFPVDDETECQRRIVRS
ncbi:hypothetical protein [Natronoarchaeum rubrum]|uniref:hypothetical protein n=1 Tax=Natronoarchaeum rubrum TaxID=755311 RepID=UPI0021122279|nr:hypothetical protein [Natronoarchaeum rubrum]